MAKVCRIFILPKGARWITSCDHCEALREFDALDPAITSARSHVSALPEGSLSQVVLQMDGGAFHPIWTLGLDAFPLTPAFPPSGRDSSPC
jgi:hypothetical protein